MRTTFHPKIKETPFERHYDRKPRTELPSYLNLPTDTHDTISAKPEKLQIYSFVRRDGNNDQLVMMTPRKWKCDYSGNFRYKFLENKKHNKNKFESNYETISQTTVAGTKHTIH